MKTFLFTAALAMVTVAAHSQKIKAAQVPAAVITKFNSLYPGAEVEKWELEDGNYEVEYEVNEVEASALFSAAGDLMENESEISVDALPQGARDYMAKNAPALKIKEAAKIVAADGTITYEAETKGGDYIFDGNGNFVKTVVAKD